jgi:hypothetical protein
MAEAVCLAINGALHISLFESRKEITEGRPVQFKPVGPIQLTDFTSDGSKNNPIKPL